MFDSRIFHSRNTMPELHVTARVWIPQHKSCCHLVECACSVARRLQTIEALCRLQLNVHCLDKCYAYWSEAKKLWGTWFRPCRKKNTTVGKDFINMTFSNPQHCQCYSFTFSVISTWTNYCWCPLMHHIETIGRGVWIYWADASC